MTVPQRVLDTMNSGLIYTCDDEEMIKAQKEQMELLYDFNATRPSQMTQRNEIARQLLGEFGEDAYIEPPLHANWGCNTYFSAHAYANFNLTLVDDGEVHIGEHTMIGPNCTIITTGIRFVLTCARRSHSILCRSPSAVMCGWAPTLPCFPASPLATIR